MKKVGLLKRLLVLIYDGFLLTAVILVAFVPLYGIFTLLPAELEKSAVGDAIKVSYITASSFIFYGWFWTHGGQTLGMKAWHLYLVNGSGKFIDWRTAFIRYAAAALSWALIPAMLYFAGFDKWYLTIGIGFMWMLTNRSRLTWHDILSGTQIVHLKK